MPLVTLTVRKGRGAEFKKSILEGVHAALVASGVPAEDQFHRVLELEAGDFTYHPTYPDLTSPRGENFVLIEILLSVGRSVKVKRQIVQQLTSGIAGKLSINPEEIMVVFRETRWENWSFGGGRFIHV
jgi:phenylpyruvate tautomerase PptA (4-oxalocrotonate tautomerase family)